MPVLRCGRFRLRSSKNGSEARDCLNSHVKIPETYVNKTITGNIIIAPASTSRKTIQLRAFASHQFRRPGLIRLHPTP